MSDSHCTAGSPDPSFGSQGMAHKQGGYCSDATTPAEAQRPRKRMRTAGRGACMLGVQLPAIHCCCCQHCTLVYAQHLVPATNNTCSAR
jgi:hypothetical protein